MTPTDFNSRLRHDEIADSFRSRFRSTDALTIEDLIEILDAWQEGLVDLYEVEWFAGQWSLLQAFEMDEGRVSPRPSNDAPYEVVSDIVAGLDTMHSLVITVDDVPALIGILQRGKEDPSGAIEAYHEYLSQIDVEARTRKRSAEQRARLRMQRRMGLVREGDDAERPDRSD